MPKIEAEDKVTLIANSFIHEIHNPDIITLKSKCRTNGSVDDGQTSGVESGRKLANRIRNWVARAMSIRSCSVMALTEDVLIFVWNPLQSERVTCQKEAATSNEAAQFDKDAVKIQLGLPPTQAHHV